MLTTLTAKKLQKPLKKHYNNAQKLLAAAATGASIVASGRTDDNKAADELLAPILHVSNEMTVSGVEFRVNTYTTGHQDYSSVTGLADGGFVVVWQSDKQDGDDFGVYGQKYSADGSTNGSEFLVNAIIADDQILPNVTSLKDGSFVITWFGEASSDFYQIYGQKYNADGTQWGDEFQINSNENDDREVPNIVGLQDGGFVVVWQSYDQDAGLNDYGIYGQRFNADGSTNGNEFQVNTHTANSQKNSAIAALDDGGFIIVWQSKHQDGDDYGIYGQKYNADGSTNGGEFLVNATTANEQSNVAISALSDGGYVITWESDGQDGSDFGIYGQVYNADHTIEKAEFLINSYVTNWQSTPSVAALSDGGFVVIWQSYDQDGDDYGIYGQRFDATGVAIDDEFQVNSYETNYQDEVSVAATENGGFVVSWSSVGQDGSDRGIYAQRYEYSDTYKLTVDASGEFEIVNLLQSEQDSSGITLGSVSISGVPDYVSFSQGSDDGNGTWTIEQSDLEGLQIITSNGEMGNFSLTLSVTLTNSSGDTSTASTQIDISVGNVITGTAAGETLVATNANDHIDGLAGVDFLDIYENAATTSYAIKGNDLQVSYGDNVDLLHSIEALGYAQGGTIEVADLWGDLGMTEAAYDIWLANSYDYNF